MDDPVTSVPSSLWASLNSWFTSTFLFVLLNLMIATIVFTSNLPNNNTTPTNHQQQEDDQQQQQKEEQKQPQIARSPSILHRLKSFNFLPPKPHPDSSPDTHYHQQSPIEEAATQFVFNQPLQYQHFDFDSTNSHQFDAPNGRYSTFDSDPTRLDSGFNLDPTRQEGRNNPGLSFDPEQFEYDPTRFDYDPIRKEVGNNTGFEFEPVDEEHVDEFQSMDEVYSKLKTGGHDRSKSDGNIVPKPPTKMKKSASLKVGFAHPEEVETVEARRPATVREKKSAVRVAEDDDVEVDSRADDFINKFKNDLKLQRIESIIRTKGARDRGAAQ